MISKQLIRTKIDGLKLELDDYYLSAEVDLEIKVAIAVKIDELRRLVAKI